MASFFNTQTVSSICFTGSLKKNHRYSRGHSFLCYATHHLWEGIVNLCLFFSVPEVDNGYTFQPELTHPLLFCWLLPFLYCPFCSQLDDLIFGKTQSRKSWRLAAALLEEYLNRGRYAFCRVSCAQKEREVLLLYRGQTVVEICVGCAPHHPKGTQTGSCKIRSIPALSLHSPSVPAVSMPQ